MSLVVSEAGRSIIFGEKAYFHLCGSSIFILMSHDYFFKTPEMAYVCQVLELIYF